MEYFSILVLMSHNVSIFIDIDQHETISPSPTRDINKMIHQEKKTLHVVKKKKVWLLLLCIKTNIRVQKQQLKQGSIVDAWV